MNLSTLFKDVDSLIWFIVGLGSTFIFTGFGSIVSEAYMLAIAKTRKISLSRSFISTVCAGFIAMLIFDNFPHMTITTYYSMCFILGLVGFNLAMKITRLDFWIELYNKKFKK